MKADTYNAQGKKVGEVTLPENVFGVAWNDSLIHQVVTGMQANARTPVAHVKTRGDVRGGGKKPWRQKGTGRSRHGSSRSPIWKGGGVTHGPRNEKVYEVTIPKQMRVKALMMALSKKLKDGEVIFVDSFGIEEPKTALANKILGALQIGANAKGLNRTKNAALIALSDPSDASVKSFRNIARVSCKAVRELNPVSVLQHGYIIIESPDAAVAILSHRTTKKATKLAAKKVKLATKEKASAPKEKSAPKVKKAAKAKTK